MKRPIDRGVQPCLNEESLTLDHPPEAICVHLKDGAETPGRRHEFHPRFCSTQHRLDRFSQEPEFLHPLGALLDVPEALS